MIDKNKFLEALNDKAIQTIILNYVIKDRGIILSFMVRTIKEYIDYKNISIYELCEELIGKKVTFTGQEIKKNIFSICKENGIQLDWNIPFENIYCATAYYLILYYYNSNDNVLKVFRKLSILNGTKNKNLINGISLEKVLEIKEIKSIPFFIEYLLILTI